MSKQAWTSTLIFFALLIVVTATRTSEVRVGMRDLPLPMLDKAAVTAIEIGGKQKALLKMTDAKWTVASPDAPDQAFPVEQDQVDRVLDALTVLEGGTFVSGRTEKHDELEVSDEKGTALTVTTGTTTPLRLVLGRFAKGGGNFARLQGGTDVYVLKGGLAGLVRKDVDAWRDKKIFDVKIDDVVSMTVTTASGTYTAIHTVTPAADDATPPKDTWALAPETVLPDGYRVDAESLNRHARALAGLRATGFFDDKAKTAGLTFTAGKASFTLKDGKTLTLVVDVADLEKKVPVRVDGGGQVFALTEFSAKNVLKSLDDHRDLSLFPDVDAARLSAVSFTFPGGKADVVKKDGAFAYNGPGAETVDVEGIEGKLSGLLKLRATKLLGTDALLKPSLKDELRIVVTLDDGSSRSVRFGSEQVGADGKPNGQVHVVNGDGMVYEIGKFQRARHEKPGELFKRVDRPPPGAGGPGAGGMPGLDSLPPEIRKQIEQQMRAQGM